MSFNRSNLLSILLTILALSMQTRIMCGAEDNFVRAGKSSTVLADLGPLGSGTAFCIDSSGLFVTNYHVVAALDSNQHVDLVLNAGDTGQRVLKAQVVHTNREYDLALLRVDRATGLLPLQLGIDTNLSETDDITAFGYPFGKMLSLEEGYPSISVSTGKITSLRKVKEELALVQIDASLNPGNSGGPILAQDGSVIGVVVSGIPGSAVSFAIPVSLVKKFLSEPRLTLDVGKITRANLLRPCSFRVQVRNPQDAPLHLTGVEITLTSESGNSKTVSMTEGQSGEYVANTTPVSKTVDSAVVHTRVKLGQLSLDGVTQNQWIRLDDKTFRLTDIQKIEFGDKRRVTMRDGKTFTGGLFSCSAVRVDLGMDVVELFPPRGESLEVTKVNPIVNSILYEVAAMNGEKVISTISGRIPVEGDDNSAPAPVKQLLLDPEAGGEQEIVVNVFLDDASDLHITPFGLYWKHYSGTKPGTQRDIEVNGKPWHTVFKKFAPHLPFESGLFPVDLRTFDLDFQLLGIGENPNPSSIAGGRSSITSLRRSHDMVVVLRDVEPGGAWYRFKLLRKQRTAQASSNVALNAETSANSQAEKNGAPGKAVDGSFDLSHGEYWFPGSRPPTPDHLVITFPERSSVKTIRMLIPMGTKLYVHGHEPLDYKIILEHGEDQTVVADVKNGQHPKIERNGESFTQFVTFDLPEAVPAERVKFICSRTSGLNYGPVIFEFEVRKP